MSAKFLRASGLVEWRPGAKTTERLTAGGGHIISWGQLCTACLVGDWPMSMFRQAQTLCDTCRELDTEVAMRRGLDRGTTAGGLPGGSARIGGLHDPSDQDWEPIRQARAYRADRLAEVFVYARGVGIVQLEEQRLGQPPVEVIAYDDLAAHDLIPDDMPSRIRRFAVWLQTLDADGYWQRCDALADVESLSRVLTGKVRERALARSWTELGRAVQDAKRVPRALASAAAGVIKAGRRIK